jgi:N-acetylglutamate synthase-like GNAT family acetyltransferase
VIRRANLDDLDAIKRLADDHKRELGFIVRSALSYSILKGEMFVAINSDNTLCGFVQFRHRKDAQTTLYNIVVAASARCQGFGYQLLNELIADAIRNNQDTILLKCPIDLLANDFYRKCGFTLHQTEPGKSRPLKVWVKRLR